MKFRSNNRIRYGQDMRAYRGIPSKIEFHVERGVEGQTIQYILTSPGYGAKGNYGNGALYVYGLNSKQKRKFEDALIEQLLEEER